MDFLNGWAIDIEKIPNYKNFKGKFPMNIDLKICKNILKSSNPVFTEEMKQELKKVIDYEKTSTNSIYQPKSILGVPTANLPIYHSQTNNLGRFYAKKISLLFHYQNTSNILFLVIQNIRI